MNTDDMFMLLSAIYITPHLWPAVSLMFGAGFGVLSLAAILWSPKS